MATMKVYDGDSPANLIGVAPTATKGQDLMANLQNPLGGPLVYPDVTRHLAMTLISVVLSRPVISSPSVLILMA